MAGYSKDREQNYEIKYLRKVLTQVDKRIQVPKSVDAASLLPLLDTVETPSGKPLSRKPRWLSFQSGIAYAAAFALIVALFYSMELYRPDMINGGLKIANSSEDEAVKQQTSVVEPAQANTDTDIILADGGQETSHSIAVTESEDPVVEPVDAAAEVTVDVPAQQVEPFIENIGGGARATLLLEEQDKAYYCRVNDEADPDRQTPVTLEIVNKSTHELISQLNIADMELIEKCFVYGDFIVAAGTGKSGAAIHIYDNSNNPSEQLALSQNGALADARLYKDIVHVISLSETPPEGMDVIELPYATSQDTCIITAINLNTLETSKKAFIGAKGTIQIHNLNAYILYEGEGDNGGTGSYIGQILFDGMSIELGTVS